MGNKGELRRVVLTELRRVVSKLRSFFFCEIALVRFFAEKGHFIRLMYLQ